MSIEQKQGVSDRFSDPEEPLVSVIIPSFNHSRYIQQCVDSVLQQTYSNIEIIICDDGSSDDTRHVLKKYEDHPSIKIFLFENNRGQSAVVLDGLAESRGEYIALLPSDDFYLPNNIERKIRKFQASPAGTGVVYSKGARFFEESGRLEIINSPNHTGRVLSHFLEGPNFVYPVTPLFLRACFDVFQFNLKARAEGEAVYPEIALHFEFEYVDEVLCVMRDHEGNTGKRLHGNLKDSESRWRIFFSRDDLPEELRRYRGKVFSWLYLIYGMGMIFDLNCVNLGRWLLIKSILNEPFKLRSLRNATIVLGTLLPFGLRAMKTIQGVKRRRLSQET